MMLPRLKLVLIAILFAGGVAAPFILSRNQEESLRDRRTILREQVQELETLGAENARLSNLALHARTNSSLIDEHELLRLRGEIGQLRRMVKEMESQSRNLGSSPRAGETAEDASFAVPDPQTVQAYWPKSQLGFAGYGDPASGLQTVLWAMTQGDTNALLASSSPRVKAVMTKEGWDARKDPALEIAESTKYISDSLSPSTGFYLVGQNLKSNDFAILDVHFEGEGKTRKFGLQRFGNEWKFAAMGRAGKTDEDLEGSAAWP